LILHDALLFQLRRFDNQGVKLDHHVRFPTDFHDRQLVAVVAHTGLDAAGHYVTYALSGSSWFLFDDLNVTAVPLATVLTAQAYILAYAHRPPLPPSLGPSTTFPVVSLSLSQGDECVPQKKTANEKEKGKECKGRPHKEPKTVAHQSKTLNAQAAPFVPRLTVQPLNNKGKTKTKAQTNNKEMAKNKKQQGSEPITNKQLRANTKSLQATIVAKPFQGKNQKKERIKCMTKSML
jgi:hypothetical protein